MITRRNLRQNALVACLLVAALSFGITLHGLLSKRQYFLGGDSIVKTVLYQAYFAGKNGGCPGEHDGQVQP